MRRGAHAEYLVIEESGAIVRTPAVLTDHEAAAIPFGGTAALAFLRDFGRVQPGQRVLVVGASGSVGTWAVQIARHLGAEVTAVCSARNLELVRSLGAHHVVDYASGGLFGEQGKNTISSSTRSASPHSRPARTRSPRRGPTSRSTLSSARYGKACSPRVPKANG